MAMPKKQTKSPRPPKTDRCFSDYNALCKYIEGLPAPKPGFTRVFRGQWKDYGNLKPTGIRKPLYNDRIWRQYCGMITSGILAQQGMDTQTALVRGEEWAYWFYALVQHYGPGTHLLDVTHSLEVSLWFALHRAFTDKRFNLKYVSTGITGRGPNLSRQDEWTSYHEFTEEPAVLYIFDVPEWTSTELPGHGVLVDLARGPEIFKDSARIQAQKGCLIVAHPDKNQGDLLQLDPPPIKVQVKWPMTGCEAVHCKTDVLFPSPDADRWYAYLLFLPIVHQVWKEEPYWRMAHPVELSMYIDHLTAAGYAVQFKPLQPPLMYPWLIEAALMRNPTPEAYERASVFLTTTFILLEGPVFGLQLDYNDASWNHAELAADPPTLTGYSDWISGAISNRPVNLTDVFFELSPLESVGWPDLLQPGAEMLVARGVHLVRSDEFNWRLQVFFQNAPREKIHLLFQQPAAIRFDPASRRFQVEGTDGWNDIATDPVAAKALCVALSLSRAVAPKTTSYMAFVETAEVVLKRAPDIGLGMHYYVMRHPKTNDPYARMIG